jgi:WD40 repeat protein
VTSPRPHYIAIEQGTTLQIGVWSIAPICHKAIIIPTTSEQTINVKGPILLFPDPLAKPATSSKPSAVSGYKDGSLILWDLNSAQPIWHNQISRDTVAGVAISSDGDFILYSAGMTLRMINRQSGDVVKEKSTGVVYVR